MPYTYGKHKEELLSPGYYRALISNATSGHSKTSGNAMLTLILDIDHGENSVRIWDYLVDAAKMLWKTKQFMKEVGEDPEAGEIDEARLPGKHIVVLLETERDKKYGDKNRVVRYGYADGDAPSKEETDGDVPF